MPNAGQKRLIASLAGPILWAGHAVLRRHAHHLDLAHPNTAERVRSVLVVRLDNIGDLLLSEPALGILRERFPNARIDLVAGPTAAPVVEGNPNIDRLIAYRAPWHDAWRGTPIDWRSEATRFWMATAALRDDRYDIGFELRGDLRDILFLAAANPAILVGSTVRGGRGLLDYDVPQDPRAHQVLNAATIAAAGAPGRLVSGGRTSVGQVSNLSEQHEMLLHRFSAEHPEVRPPQLYLTPAQRAKAGVLLPAGSTAIAVHLGAGFPSKQLPLEKVAAAVSSLHGRDPQRRFVLVGGPEDQPFAGPFQQHVSVGVTDLTAKLSILETAAVLERCDLFMGNDSAPMHLAAAVGTPVVAWFGPSEPWRFRPYSVPHRLMEVDLDCRPCDYVHCIWPVGQKYQCMARQDVTAIVAAAEDLLRSPLSSS